MSFKKGAIVKVKSHTEVEPEWYDSQKECLKKYKDRTLIVVESGETYTKVFLGNGRELSFYTFRLKLAHPWTVGYDV